MSRSVTVLFRTTPEGAAELDRLRGNLTRSTYLRWLLAQASKNHPRQAAS